LGPKVVGTNKIKNIYIFKDITVPQKKTYYKSMLDPALLSILFLQENFIQVQINLRKLVFVPIFTVVIFAVGVSLRLAIDGHKHPNIQTFKTSNMYGS
jgi:hypothetical protein